MRIVFMGTPEPASLSLRRLMDAEHDIAAVYTQPDRPSGRSNKIIYSPVKQLALHHGIEVRQPEKIKTPEALTDFAALEADVAVVVAYGRILPEGFLKAFNYGAVNVHFSLLPKYRGAAPVNWAIARGERQTGVTTMIMDTGLDTGDILMSREIEIAERETAPELMARLGEIGADLLTETLEGIGTLVPIQQDHSAATLAPILKREDGLIDWAMSAIEISDRVRGFQPFPGTFTYHGLKKMNIWSATPSTETHVEPALPGTVASVESGHLIVAAGDGTALRVGEVQFEGKRRMSVRDALNGGHLATGDRFSATLAEPAK